MQQRVRHHYLSVCHSISAVDHGTRPRSLAAGKRGDGNPHQHHQPEVSGGDVVRLREPSHVAEKQKPATWGSPWSLAAHMKFLCYY